MSFTPGDRVLIDNNVVATVQVWDEATNIFVYVVNQGNATNTVTSHCTTSHVELLTPAPQAEKLPLPETAEPAAQSDEQAATE